MQTPTVVAIAMSLAAACVFLGWIHPPGEARTVIQAGRRAAAWTVFLGTMATLPFILLQILNQAFLSAMQIYSMVAAVLALSLAAFIGGCVRKHRAKKNAVRRNAALKQGASQRNHQRNHFDMTMR